MAVFRVAGFRLVDSYGFAVEQVADDAFDLDAVQACRKKSLRRKRTPPSDE